MLKKYLKMVGVQILYLAIILLAFRVVFHFNWLISKYNEAYKTFIGQNVMLITLVAMVVAVLVTMLTYLLRKKNLFEICSFKKVSWKNTGILLFAGIGMAFFTVSLINIPAMAVKFPKFHEFMNVYTRAMSNLPALLIIIIFVITAEEILYRGVIFNEFRKVIPLVPAILLSALLYGIPNGIFNPDWIVGVFAFFSSACYTLPYAWTGSLISAIWVQIVCQSLMLICWKLGINTLFANTNPALVVLLTIVGALVMGAGFYLLWRNTRQQNASA